MCDVYTVRSESASLHKKSSKVPWKMELVGLLVSRLSLLSNLEVLKSEKNSNPDEN